MLIYGIHACKSAIDTGRRVTRIFAQKGKPLPKWVSQNVANKVRYIETHEFGNMLPKHAVHQGIAMEVEDTVLHDITELEHTPERCVVAILDGVTDPHNFGAIIRTAAAFGLRGVIVSEKSSCKITGTVAKAASGGLDCIDAFSATNLSRTIEQLKKYGFWVVALCERGEKFLHEVDLQGRVCLILGAEGDGIRRLQKEHSDFVAKLPTNQNFPTLNVSTSAAVAFYEAAKQNGFDLRK